MKRKEILLLVEGETEEKFIKEVLVDYFNRKDIKIIPIIIKTKCVANGKDYKGGIVKYEKFKKEIKDLLGDTNAACVSTMIDLYGLPKDFPGNKAVSKTGKALAEHIEDSIKKDINNDKFIPYLSLHEFEALLFSDPTVHQQDKMADEIKAVLEKYNGQPETINNDPKNIPSKHLENIIKHYKKVRHGLIFAGRTRLEVMQEKCPHFNEWIQKLENKVCKP